MKTERPECWRDKCRAQRLSAVERRGSRRYQWIARVGMGLEWTDRGLPWTCNYWDPLVRLPPAILLSRGEMRVSGAVAAASSLYIWSCGLHCCTWAALGADFQNTDAEDDGKRLISFQFFRLGILNAVNCLPKYCTIINPAICEAFSLHQLSSPQLPCMKQSMQVSWRDHQTDPPA